MPPDPSSWFIAHRSRLVDYATGLIGSRTHAEDLVQEAWLRFDEVTRQRILSEPLAYLYRIVRNLALDGHRRRRREERIFVDTDLEAAATSGASPATPERLALYRDQLRLLDEALNDLPKRTRIAFEMHRFGGCKLREIAAFLDISLPRAGALVAEAVQHCKQRCGWP